MASSASTRDLSKAINAYMQAPSLPLPDNLNDVIAAYLDRHEKYDDAASDRLHEELTTIFNKLVIGHAERYAPFLALLRPLRPALRKPARIVQWWDRFLELVLENLNVQKGLAGEALRSVIELVAFEEDDDDKPATDGPNIFADRLLSRWMQLNALNEAATGSGSGDSKEMFMQEAIMVFGKNRPKDFLLALNSFFIKKEYRNRSLNLLCSFVQSQPPHLHLVLQTPLFENILRSLQQDESTTTVSLGLVSLFMLLPNMPSSLVPHLPTLFNIYARLLFWDRDRSFAQEHAHWEPESKSGGAPAWDKCLFDNDLDAQSVHHLSTYFTILYGLYPLNFVDYIRKPQRYLRHANSTDDIDVQAMEIRDRSERFRRCHLLHPNFYQLTVDSEKTDFSRWLKSEPAEVITDCMNLCISTDGNAVQPEESGELLSLPEPDMSSPMETHTSTGGERPLLSRMTSPQDMTGPEPELMSVASPSTVGDSRDQSDLLRKPSESSHATTRDTSARASFDVRARDVSHDSPTLPAQLAKAASHAQLQDIIHSNKVIKSGLHQLANDSVPSLALSNTDSYHDSGFLQLQPAHRGANSPNTQELLTQIASLQRQALLLQNDLHFETYMKHQHMAHVGALRRKQLREAATEAEAQNLIMANRSLKYRLEESQRKEAQIRKEADHRRNMAKKWESSQSDKLRHFRELQKKWTMDETLLKNDLNAAKEECVQLRKRVLDLEEKQLRWAQDTEAFEAGKEQIRKLKEEIQQLSASVRKYQGTETEMKASVEEARQAESRAEQRLVTVTARENLLLAEHKKYEARIADLQRQLADAKSAHRDQQRAATAKELAAQVYDFRAMQNKYAELQKQYALVRKKYQIAQASLLDLQCDMEEKKVGAFWAAQNETRTKSREEQSQSDSATESSRDLSLRGRVLSDPELPSRTSETSSTFNATAPLPGSASAHAKGAGLGFQYHSNPQQQQQQQQQRPGIVSTPTTGSEEIRAQRTISAGDVRYFSRGIQNNPVRKERSGSAKKDDKKEKKSAGVSLMRGFRHLPGKD